MPICQSWINCQSEKRLFELERFKKEEQNLLYKIIDEIGYYEAMEVIKPLESADLTFDFTSLDEIALDFNPLVELLEIIKVTIVKMGKKLHKLKNFDF